MASKQLKIFSSDTQNPQIKSYADTFLGKSGSLPCDKN